MSEESRKDLRKRLLRGIQLVVQGDPGSTLSGQPVEDFIAGPEPSNPFSRFQWRTGRAACDRWARTGRAGLLPGRDLYYRNLCEPYLGEGLPGDPFEEGPFQGGQCPVDYQTNLVGLVVRNIFGGSDVINEFPTGIGGRGPITVATSVIRPEGGALVTTTGATGTFTIVVFPSNTVLDAGTPRLVRIDNQPDNCGDPEGDFNPGEPNPTPDPNPGPIGAPTGYPFPNLDISINPDGTINVEFGDGSPDATIDPGTGIDAPPPAGDIGEPGPTADTGASGDADGEAPEGKVLTALKLNILSSPPQLKEYKDGFFRGAAYVFMGTADGVDMDFSGSILTDGQIVLAEKENLTHWLVSANSGYNFRVTPYYRQE